MIDANLLNWWRRLLALPNDSPVKSLAVAALVALACGSLVSVTAVVLRPLQEKNLERERQARMQDLLKSLPGMKDLIKDAGAGVMQPVLVELATGDTVKDVNPLTYDQRAAAADPIQSVQISPADDIAGLGRRAKRAPAYLVWNGGKLAQLILPVRGSGYQSMLYGYLALEGDLVTVAGLTFYEQAETPGLGNRIVDAVWQQQWPGKKITDEQGTLRVEVVRGGATGPHQVDGISGATRTGRGVTNLLRYWLGEQGFGPFLKQLAAGKIKR